MTATEIISAVTKRTYLIILSIFGLLLTACFGDTHRYLVKNLSVGETKYEIKIMYSCCGCQSIYANKYVANRIKEQLIHESNCSGTKPTKYIFDYYYQKQVIRTAVALIAVTDSSFTMPVTNEELVIFKKLDSIHPLYRGRNAPNYSNIKGFRKPKENENIHPFGINKKGDAVRPTRW